MSSDRAGRAVAPGAIAVILVLVPILAGGACATSSTWAPPGALDTRDDPEKIRPGYGDRTLRVWWPLTPPEVAALDGLELAKRGDAHALLALAILASGDHRDAASAAAYQRRVDQFVAEVRPAIAAAADDWHRGYELHRAMHRAFFGGERTDLGSYDVAQTRITAIFETGRYNCLSSAILFVVLARAFGLPVRAALVPTHVFVEMGAPGGKTIEVETTSGTGFDWVHDERFYREEAANWSARRGLRPVSFEEYEQRRVLEPYQLMAIGLQNPRPGEDAERAWSRYAELAGIVDPDDPKAGRKARVEAYINESVDLHKQNAWRTLAKLYDTVEPAVVEIGAQSRDAATLELISWTGTMWARALMIVGRTNEALALMNDGFNRLDPAWPDAHKLKDNYLGVLTERLGQLVESKDYAAAAKMVESHREICRSDKVCTSNIGVVYGNWSNEYQRTGDWQGARQVLQQCLTESPEDANCRDALADLESRHRF